MFVSARGLRLRRWQLVPGRAGGGGGSRWSGRLGSPGRLAGTDREPGQLGRRGDRGRGPGRPRSTAAGARRPRSCNDTSGTVTLSWSAVTAALGSPWSGRSRRPAPTPSIATLAGNATTYRTPPPPTTPSTTTRSSRGLRAGWPPPASRWRCRCRRRPGIDDTIGTGLHRVHRRQPHSHGDGGAPPTPTTTNWGAAATLLGGQSA